MRLMLNGSEREVPDLPSVEALIEHLKVHRMIVVQVNGDILRRESYGVTPLKDGDVVEIVHMVPGG
jgi:sulfur carrier protein